MIRPAINVTNSDGQIDCIYPPLQWNRCISKRKITTDVREWLHINRPNWKSASLILMHYNRNGYNETIKLERK